MDPQEKATLQLQNALKECFEQIRFARAAELARSRRYVEAEGLLSPNGRECSDTRELDLLARISAQQRQYGRACRHWEAALKQSPGNTEYERAIECAKAAEHFQKKLRKVAVIALLAFSAAVLVIAVWNFFPQRSPTVASDGGQQPDVHSKATSLPPTFEPTQVPQPAPAAHKPEPPPAPPAVALPPAPATPQPAPTTPPVAVPSAPATPQPAPATLKPEPQPAPANPKPEPPPATPPVPPSPAPAPPVPEHQ